MRRWTIIAYSLPLVLCLNTGVSAQETGESDFDYLHKMIQPGKHDSQWMNVSWMSAINIWAARQKAAAEGRPIFLWYMAGEPLGPC